MRVLVACEFSGVVRRSFRNRGHDAWSCDLLPAEDGSRYHWEGDALFAIRHYIYPPWDLMIAHPPCTHLAVSGARWFKEKRGEQATALQFVRELLAAPIPRIALENPISIISSRIRKPDQIIQPHQFGEDASKATCLWLKNLPLMVPTHHVAPRIVNGRQRWANQTDSGQNRLGPSPERARIRAETYAGIAAAMADQRGNA